MPIISFVGSSGSGKTTLVENVIKSLIHKGLKISYLKHGYGLDLDKEGKDTWRMQQAGASKVFMLSPEKYAFIANGEANLDEVVHLAADIDTDILFIEGYKQSTYPKIEVFRKENGKPLVCENDQNLLAIATDSPIDTNLRVLDLNNPEETVDFIIDYLSNFHDEDKISILINNNRVKLDEETIIKIKETLKPYLSDTSNIVDLKLVINKDPKRVFLQKA